MAEATVSIVNAFTADGKNGNPATIATWALLHELGEIKAGNFTQETLAGILQVVVQDDGRVFMEQTQAAFFEEIAPDAITSLLGIMPSDFSDKIQPQIVSTGIRDLLVPVSDKSVLKRIQPNLDKIAKFSRQHDISGLHVFALLKGKRSIASARNFAPADGIPHAFRTYTLIA